MALAGFQHNQITDATPLGTWVSRDLSGSPFNVPANAAGVIIEVVNTAGSTAYGARKNGSTDDRAAATTDDLNSNGHTWIAVGVDSSRLIELNQEAAGIDWYLRAYFDGNDETFDLNATQYTPTTGNWNNVDIATQTGGETAIAAVIEAETSALEIANARNNGSTDNRPADMDNHSWFLVGVDGSEIFDFYRASTNTSVFVLGWLTGAATFLVNGINRTGTVATDETFGDLDALSTGAIGGYIEVAASGAADFHVRKKGDTDDAPSPGDDTNEDMSSWVGEVDGSRIAEARRVSGIDFFELGIALAAAAPASLLPPRRGMRHMLVR